MSQVRFTCPRCQVTFPVILQDNRFACPECAGAYQFTRVNDHDLGWTIATQTWLWETTVIQPIDRRFEFLADTEVADSNLGAARTRKLMRQSRGHARKQAAVLFLSLVLAGLFFLGSSLAPAIAGSASPDSLRTEVAIQVSQPVQPDQPVLATPTATPLPAASTATRAPATSTSLPTHTPAPISHELLVATAWEATLDQAVVQSYATQTRNAQQYFSTQTALPPVLTAKAFERGEFGTATAEAGMASH